MMRITFEPVPDSDKFVMCMEPRGGGRHGPKPLTSAYSNSQYCLKCLRHIKPDEFPHYHTKGELYPDE